MTKPFTITVQRDVGHPFTGAPGWSQMIVKFKDEKVEEAFTAMAKEKGWDLLIDGWDSDPHCTGDQLPMNLYYKPDGAHRSWVDPTLWPYPQEWI